MIVVTTPVAAARDEDEGPPSLMSSRMAARVASPAWLVIPGKFTPLKLQSRKRRSEGPKSARHRPSQPTARRLVRARWQRRWCARAHAGHWSAGSNLASQRRHQRGRGATLSHLCPQTRDEKSDREEQCRVSACKSIPRRCRPSRRRAAALRRPHQFAARCLSVRRPAGNREQEKGIFYSRRGLEQAVLPPSAPA